MKKSRTTSGLSHSKKADRAEAIAVEEMFSYAVRMGKGDFCFKP
jgi:hypothetical protein